MTHIPLPSVDALVAFESAARHQSFTRAAAELNLTQAAISRQIRVLEDRPGAARHVDVQLARRKIRLCLQTHVSLLGRHGSSE